jgi:hypothetical protein
VKGRYLPVPLGGTGATVECAIIYVALYSAKTEEDEMRKLATGLMMGLMVVGLAKVAFAQRNPRGTSTLTINGKTVSVEYGRPSLKGRTTDDLLGRLEHVWRLGADKSTTFKSEVDLAFGNVTIPTGEYSLWMQRQADKSWKLVFNKQHGQWGTQHDAAQDLASVPLKETKLAKPVEMVTITLAKARKRRTITIQWGTLEVSASFTAK